MRFAFLDLARMVAASLVFFYHFYPSVLPIFAGSWLMVDFFFVLSGLVLSKQIQTMGQSLITLKEFIAKRAIRIYPALFAFFLASSTLDIFQKSEFDLTSISIILGSTLLLQVFSPVFLGSNIPLWSLSVELSVNFLSKFFGRSFHSNLVGLLLGISLEIFYLGVGERLGFYWVPVLGLGRALAGFNAGLIAMRLIESGFILPRFGISLSLVSTVSLLSFAGDNKYFSILLLPFFTLLVIGLATSPKSFALRSAFSLLGQLSYGFYIWHLPVGNTIDSLVSDRLVSLNLGMSVAILIFKLVSTLLIAAASYFLFEVKLRRISSRF
jgi:peptidoglycan/LPS O-acetylase OafA/YrhL